MPMIREEFLNTLRERLDIEEFIGGYVSLKRQGRISKGLCPFHSEKTPSFAVYGDTQSFYCFGCGKGGDIITFTRDIENLDYVDAVKLLADKAGLQMPDDNYDDTMSKKRKRMLEMNKEAARFFYASLMSEKGKECLSYWTDTRRLTPQTIKHFGLGYAPNEWRALRDYMRQKGYSDQELFEANLLKKSVKGDRVNYYDNFRNRAMVPIIDLRGNIIAFGGRVLDDSKPKYINTSDTLVYKKSQALFALNYAKSSGKKNLILCEGYLDVITLHQAGFTNAVAGCGTALTDEQVRLISRYTDEVILCYDNDEAGREATNKAMSKFDRTDLSIRSLTLNGGKDPDEIIRNHGAERFKNIVDGASNETEYRLLEKRNLYDLSTDDGKVKFLKDAAPILARLQSPVEREIYISRLADDLSVSKEAIQLQVKEQAQRMNRRSNRVDFGTLRHEFDQYQEPHSPSGKDQHLKARKAEETILSSLLNNPDFYGKMERILQPEDFPSDFGKRAYEILGRRLKENQSIELIYLSSEFTPEDMSKIARLQTGTSLISNTYAEVNDCIQVLKAEKDRKDLSDPSTLSDEEFRNLFKKK